MKTDMAKTRFEYVISGALAIVFDDEDEASATSAVEAIEEELKADLGLILMKYENLWVPYADIEIFADENQKEY